MLITGIKSRPVYTALQPDGGGRFHLLAGEGAGGAALLRLLSALPGGAAVDGIYAIDPNSHVDWSPQLRSGGLSHLRTFPAPAQAVAELDRTLSTCIMGTRLYIAGSESFIGAAVQVTMKYNLNRDEVQCEQCGSTARRVYCIHCQTSTENVTTNIVPCAGCGRHLLVRDHYSRRLAAYMGVMADAESPGVLPPIRDLSG